MGIKSTHFVTREFALEAIQHKLQDLSDRQLANILEEVIASDFHNFLILTHKELEVEKNSEWGCFYLDDISQLPEPYDQYNQ